MPVSAKRRQLRTALCNLIKRLLDEEKTTYRRLALKLSRQGFHETERSVRSKLSRGTFSAEFFVMVLKVLDYADDLRNLKTETEGIDRRVKKAASKPKNEKQQEAPELARIAPSRPRAPP